MIKKPKISYNTIRKNTCLDSYIAENPIEDAKEEPMPE